MPEESMHYLVWVVWPPLCPLSFSVHVKSKCVAADTNWWTLQVPSVSPSLPLLARFHQSGRPYQPSILARHENKKKNQMAGPLVGPLVAIDFGTYNSGYAFAANELDPAALQQKRNVRALINVKHQWPGSSGDYPKHRTALLYQKDLREPLHEYVDWGNLAWKKSVSPKLQESGMLVFLDRIKLLLNNEWAASEAGQLVMDQLAAVYPDAAVAGHRVEHCIGVYLKHMASEVQKDIQSRKGGSPPDLHTIRWVLTVPAMWTPRAKARMRKAMSLAGLIPAEDSANLLLCLEPEAALLSVAMTSESVKVDDNVLVVDCGGGTIDLAAFSVVKNPAAEGSIHMLELAPGEGIIGGSSLVDQAFEAYLRTVLGPAASAKLFNSSELRAKAMNAWQTIKNSFDGTVSDGSNEITIGKPIGRMKDENGVLVSERIIKANKDAIPGNTDPGEGEVLQLSTDLVRSFFHGVLDQIRDVTLRMLDKCSDPATGATAVNKVACVGGFSTPYVVGIIRKDVTKVHSAVRVLVPATPGSAVLEGAVIFGVDPNVVQSRCLRQTIGYQCRIRATDDQDLSDVDWYRTKKGRRMIRYGFRKVATLGELKTRGEVCQCGVSVDAGASDAELRVYISNQTQPLSIEDDGCQHVGTVKVTISPSATERGLDVAFVFGATEISVMVTNSANGEVFDTSLQYE
ncbi:hypothetical protein BC828DRAFT_376948 [Blastocladiella britannica]|nr:hypothetical protein BC828DRAFT_376948 [Blastocladiella britannica]